MGEETGAGQSALQGGWGLREEVVIERDKRIAMQGGLGECWRHVFLFDPHAFD
jgi:hypothetical protein